MDSLCLPALGAVVPARARQRGLLYDQAAQFARDLETAQGAASDQMLAAWSESYWRLRREVDTFLAKVAAAKAEGQKPGVSWAYQERRLQAVLAEARTQMARYASQAAQTIAQAQRGAIAAGAEHAHDLGTTVVDESLPGLEGTFTRVNPAVLEAGIGFMGDGTVLTRHLERTLPAAAADAIRDALLHGLAAGHSQDKMLRAVTDAAAVAHGRAVTILRTESLRAYREASRRTYEANTDVLEGWVWNAHLDSRTCAACVVMDGTLHPLDATLDGHPRCRCAMIPRAKGWAALGVPGMPDTRPPLRSGKAWLEDQSERVQRAILGRGKYEAWRAGEIGLDDVVARTHDAAWGTMRTERSLKAIREGRGANYFDPIPGN